MTQYIRPAQAYGAVSAPIAAVAAFDQQNLAYLRRRMVDVIGKRKGTMLYGTIQAASTVPYLTLSDAIYAQMVADGVNFSDAQYNSATAPGTMGPSAVTAALWNHGKFKQVVDFIGTSIVNSAIGSGSFPELTTISNKIWAQPVTGILNRPYNTVLGVVAHDPDYCYTCGWTHSNSRLVRNFGRDSARLTNISGFTYTQGSPWLDNFAQLDKGVIHLGQQHVILIDALTNDVKYGDDNSNGGLAAVPLGTAGASSTGSVNAITNALIPVITNLRAKYPTAKIGYSTPLARGLTGILNNKFVDIANYVVANRVALGLDFVIDTRNIPEVNPATPSVTANTTYYQNDNTHLIAAANIIIGTYQRAALDALLV